MGEAAPEGGGVEGVQPVVERVAQAGGCGEKGKRGRGARERERE